MKKRKDNFSPPRTADRFLEWFCKSEWVEPVKGDLFEQYQIDRSNKNRWRANLLYWRNVMNFLRPFALKKSITKSNHTAMFTNVLKTFFRNLRRNPLQNFINIFGLSIGLVVVFLTMLWVSYHSSFDNFHKEPESIYKVMTNNIGSSGEIQTSNGAIYEVMADAEVSIPQIKHVTKMISNWRWPSEQCFKIDENRSCIYTKGIYADSAFFKIFDFKILAGDQNPLLKPKNIALSKSLAKKLYGDENPIGKIYRMDNHFEVTISAIFEDVPKNSSLQFEFIAPLDIAYMLWGTTTDNIKEYSFITYTRILDANPDEIEEQIQDLSISQKYEDSKILLHPLNKVHLYNDFKNGEASGGLILYMRIIGLFAIFILIMSIVNFINLITAQATMRGKEIAVRKVNGASKSTLHLQFLFETLLKVCFASLLALLASIVLLDRLNRIIDESIHIDLDISFILQVSAIILVTTLLSGIYPALILSRFNPIRILKNMQFGKLSKSQIRKWLTIAQVSISGMIVILTSGFYLQLDYIQNQSIGYDREGIMMMEPTYRHIKNFEAFKNKLTEHTLIKSVGASNANMINASYFTDQVSWLNKNPNEKTQFKAIGGTRGLFDVFELDFLQGEGFNQIDTARQVILSEKSLQVMGLEDPINKRITAFGAAFKIVGVVKDLSTNSLHENIAPTIYYQVPVQNTGTIYIRYDITNPVASIEFIENQYDELEPFFNMKYQILDDEYQQLYDEEKKVSKLSLFVMIVSLIIALMGILGLSTFNILRRYKEIGLRKVFGANASQIIQLLSKEFVWIAVIANLIAWPLSLLLMDQWLSNFAYRIDTPYHILLVNLFITLGVIFVMVCFQSLKAATLNPVNVIRNE